MLLAVALIFMVSVDFSVCDNLLLVQSVWRHGDRTPTRTCKGDKNTEKEWMKFGGYGQLTPRGMAQHVKLGELIHKRYAKDYKFLSETYSPKEIYVRSTDLNRTLISAVSNMIGMYYNTNDTRSGEAFPESKQWPYGFVPIPIHTIDDNTDYVANPNSYCPRRTWLWEQAEKTDEMISLREETKDFIKVISKRCQEDTDLVHNMWQWRDSFYIELLYNLTIPVNDEEFVNMTYYNNIVEDRENGICKALKYILINSLTDINEYNGINFRIELGKIRGGGLLWEMIKHNDLKLYCLEEENTMNPECKWMNNLKYYAYSAHDTTVAAMLAVVGAKEEVISKNGYPEYSSAVLMELWNTTNDGICIKVFFHRNFSTEFEDITMWANGCDGYSCCPFKKFRHFSKPYYPSNDEESLCADVTSKSTYFDPDEDPLIYTTTTPAHTGSSTRSPITTSSTVIWRHGDRTPTWTCKGDPHKEDAWMRFGGYGELTPTGMEQHIGLGDLIYQKYALKEHFLSEKYNSKEIYVRSTDINRTMVSATSNMMGMYYSRNNAVAGEDYPESNVKWPPQYVPVPIHTVRNFDDYVMNPDAVCPRQNWLWSKVLQTSEYKNFKNKHQKFMDEVSNTCQESISLDDDLWKVKDAFKIEKIYNLSLIVTETQFQNILSVNNRVEDMQNGLGINDYDGINFRVEIGKIRGGTLLWDMIAHMDLKHDTTVGALLAVLNAKPKIIKAGGYPEYSSAVVIELHKNDTTSCVKFLFHRDFNSKFEDITTFVEGCENTKCCSFSKFRQLYKKFYPSSDEVKTSTDIELTIFNAVINAVERKENKKVSATKTVRTKNEF
uniref:acid phosphatase n=1 Tax=Syphacia muris TaxID=451379 RepID=A0A0N5AYL6_9BILA